MTWSQAVRCIIGPGRVTLLIGILALMASGATYCQPLRDVVADTLKTNPKVLAADAVRRSTVQDLAQARGGYFPTLDVNVANGRETTSNPTSRAATGSDNVSLNRRESGVLLTQNLFAGGATMSEVERQNARVNVATSKLAETREEVALRTAEVYIEVLKNRELVRLAVENLKAHLGTRDRVRQRVEGGVSQKVDLQQALGRLAQAGSAVSARAGRLREVEANYTAVVGQAPGQLVDPQGSTTRTVVSGTVDTSRLTDLIKQATDAAVTANPSLSAANAEIAAAEAAVRGAKAPYLPRLNLELSANRNDNIAGLRGQSDSDAAMLVLRWNLFRGGSDLAQERSLAERRYAAIDSAASTRRDVEEKVALAHFAKATSEERLSYLREHASLSAEVLEAYKQQLDIGRRTLLDVLNAENELFVARSNLTAGRYEDLFNQYSIEAAKGTLVDSLGIKPAD
jgi:adhesin transport system outer membrane protein